MSDEKLNPANSTFVLCIHDWEVYDTKEMLKTILDIQATLARVNKWTHEFVPPISIEVFKFQETIEKKRFLSKKTKQVEVDKHAYILHFDRILTPIEIDMWRMFKHGYFIGLFHRSFRKFYK